LKLHFEPNIWVCPYLTQIWVQTTQHCLECRDFSPDGLKKKKIFIIKTLKKKNLTCVILQ